MRRVYSALFIVIFIAVQFIPALIGIAIAYNNPALSDQEILSNVMIYQMIAFIIGAAICIWLHTKHTNPNRIERGPQSSVPLTVVWVVAGLFIAFIAQAVSAMINVGLLGNPLESANTEMIMGMIQDNIWIIFAVAVFGPIIEEFVFRRAIFGEIYEVIPGPKVVAFFVAAILSGFVFALAHLDFTHIIVYMGMSFAFSFLYVISGRILVPILVHMLMNGTVVLFQLLGPSIEELESQLNVVIHVLRFVVNTF